MTTVNQSKKFYLPFALPKYGTATQQNQYFMQQAGGYLMPMRSFAYSIVEQQGGVVVAFNTRQYNAEFKVANGQHFMAIMRAMNINITHMTEVPGGFKCHKDGNKHVSVCFVKKHVVRGTGAIEYTAVLAMRHVARELFLGAFPPQQAPQNNFMHQALDTTSRAYQDAQQLFQTATPTPEQVKYTTPLSYEELEAIDRRNEQQFIDEMQQEAKKYDFTEPMTQEEYEALELEDEERAEQQAAQNELPFPEVQISAEDLPLGL